MKIKDLLTPETWTQGYWARDEYGAEVPEDSHRAATWCLTGWVYRCYHDRAERAQVFTKILRAVPGGLIARWQDRPDTSFADVKRLVDRLDV